MRVLGLILRDNRKNVSHDAGSPQGHAGGSKWLCFPLILLLLICAYVNLARAETARLGFGQFKHVRWTADDGAPAGILDIAQTRDGFLWLATISGLYRFDGVTFEAVPGQRGSPMERAGAGKLLVRRSGELVVGYGSHAGIAVYRNGALHDLKMPTPPPEVTGLAEMKDGTLWVSWGGEAQRLWRLNKGRWTSGGKEWGLPPGYIVRWAATPDDTLWLTFLRSDGTGSLLYMRRGETRFRASAEHVLMAGTAVDPAGRLWLADASGTRLHLDGDGRPAGRGRRFPAVPGLRLAELTFDRSGGVWGSTSAAGIFYIPHAMLSARGIHDGVRRFRATDGLTSDAAATVYADREDNVWVGTEFGLDQFHAVPAVNEPTIPADTTKGILLAGTEQGDVYIVSQDILYRVAPRLAPRPMERTWSDRNSLCPARGGGVWLTYQRHPVVRVADSHRRQLPPPPGGGFIYSCAEDAQGRLWAEMEGGKLVHHDWAGWHSPAGPLRDLAVDQVIATPDAGVMFRTRDGRLGRIRGDRVHITRLPATFVGTPSIIVAGKRDIFVGGAAGLARIRDGHIRRVEVRRYPWIIGLRGLVQTSAGDTWLLTKKEISKVRTADLDAAFETLGAPLARRTFDGRDGLNSIVQHAGFVGSAQAAVGGDGRAWFLNRAGATFIDPSRSLPNAIPPPVVIRSLRSGDFVRNDPVSATLPAGTRSVDISYTALSLVVPQRVRFRYRLKDVDEYWVDPGDRRLASYANLGPGQYRFEVLAANNDGLWNMDGAALEFTIMPAWYDTWAFRVFGVIVILGLLWLAYSWRLRRAEAEMQRRAAERVDERERIARELHDTLLQSVQALTWKIQAAVDDLPVDGPVRRQLEAAIDQADEVTAEGRDRVRQLRPPRRELDPAKLMALLVRKHGFDEGTEVTIRSDGTPRAVDPVVVEQATMIADEAIFNIRRHAQARCVTIEVAYGQDFSLRFVDDGVGFDAEAAADHENPGHFGLIGMRERAAELHGRLSIKSQPPKGSVVLLTIPGGMAYHGEGSYRRPCRWRR